jgi:hypothetical protein
MTGSRGFAAPSNAERLTHAAMALMSRRTAARWLPSGEPTHVPDEVIAAIRAQQRY